MARFEIGTGPQEDVLNIYLEKDSEGNISIRARPTLDVHDLKFLATITKEGIKIHSHIPYNWTKYFKMSGTSIKVIQE